MIARGPQRGAAGPARSTGRSVSPGAGANAGFAHAVLPHLDAAYRLAHWLVRDRSAAEDVVQDALVRAMTYFGTYRGADARAWLLQIVRNTAYSRLAHRSGQEAPLDDAAETPDPADDPEAALARTETVTNLAGAVEALPTELRECLVLRELEEMSYRDIARVTGVPTGTVMSRLWRARRALLRHGDGLRLENPA
jgi:RNA polymerase sigma-70 factor (ECF subfamily)